VKVLDSTEKKEIINVLPTSSVPDWWIEGLDIDILKDKTIDRLLGTIYGNCLGDAYGLATEFMSKEDVNDFYGPTEVIPFPKFKRNHHNSRWKIGDCTDDSDQMLLILESIMDTKGNIPVAIKKFAWKLLYWAEKGFPELGDKGGLGIGKTTLTVLSDPAFVTSPQEVAKKIWDGSSTKPAPNGGVMRTSITGCYKYSDIPVVVDNTIQFCKVTHYDSRCVASCVATSAAIALMLQGKYILSSGELDIDTICGEAYQLALMHTDAQEDFLTHVTAEKVQQLQLDDKRTIGYTLKCVGSGFWGLRSKKNFKDTLLELIREGGDADTNGAVCGALLGCKLGYSQLPKDWLASLLHKTWLDRKVIAFLKFNGNLP